MKKYISFLFLALMSLSVFSQDQAPPKPSTGKQLPGTGYDGLKPYDLYPVAIYDPRISVKGVTFIRRYADTGRGEFLDVQVELQSRVPQDHNYSIYILAAYERDRVNDSERELIPYPAWRKWDPLKEDRILYFSNLMPEQITAKEVWGEELFNKKKTDLDKLHWKGFPAEFPEPTFDEVVDYLCKNPAKALPLTVFGESGPPKEKVVVFNYIAQTAEEKKRYVHETLPKHTYTIYNNKYQTSFTSHHYTEYRPNFLAFNKVAVLVFDPSKQVNNLLFRKFYDISDLKITY